jgi:hypothetical protein
VQHHPEPPGQFVRLAEQPVDQRLTASELKVDDSGVADRVQHRHALIPCQPAKLLQPEVAVLAVPVAPEVQLVRRAGIPQRRRAANQYRLGQPPLSEIQAERPPGRLRRPRRAPHAGRRRGEPLIPGAWQLHPIDCPGPELEVLPEERCSDQLMHGCTESPSRPMGCQYLYPVGLDPLTGSQEGIMG